MHRFIIKPIDLIQKWIYHNGALIINSLYDSYLISRALGPKLGGAVGLLYYLGVVLQSVLEVGSLNFSFISIVKEI